VRPWAIADPAAYRARLARVLAHAHVVKVSQEDLEWLGTSAEDLAEDAVVLVTRGADGATVVTPHGGPVDVPAPPVEVVDTIGAGDAFGGGFLAWWSASGLGRDDLERPDLVIDAVRFATRVAGITCSRAGASPPRLRDVPTGS
jgi:fructokinase